MEDTGNKGVKPMPAKSLKVVAAVAVLLMFSGLLFAHHGTAAYDTVNPLTLKGTVTDFRFINPHCQVYFDIKNDKGEVEHWQGELTAPNKLARAGWTKHTLNPGPMARACNFQKISRRWRTTPAVHEACAQRGCRRVENA
jgi:hypothetical protein